MKPANLSEIKIPPVNIGLALITKLEFDLVHVNYGLDSKTKKYRKKARSNFSEVEIANIFSSLDGFFLNPSGKKGDYLYFDYKIEYQKKDFMLAFCINKKLGNSMTYPTKEQIISIMADIEKLNKNGKTGKLKPLPKNATPLEKWKFRLSQKIAEFRVMKGLSLEDMSNLLATDKANISRIINGHIEKVTLDKLMQYIEIILIASKNKNASKKFHANADKFFELDDVKFA